MKHLFAHATLAAALFTLAATNIQAQARHTPRPIGAAFSIRDATPADAAWPLTESRKRDVKINFLEKLTAPALDCVYRKPGGGGGYRLTYWDGSRPDPSRFGQAPYPIDIDVALDACPATWGEAVAIGWGVGAWEAAVAEEMAAAVKRNAVAARLDARARETPESRRRDWLTLADSLANTPEAEGLALARGIDAEIGAMESQIDALRSRPFNDLLVNPGGLFERINRLGQIAYAKSRALNPLPAGRPAFDAWDERLGGPAVSAVARLQKIAYYRQNRRVRMAEVTGDAGQSEMASWGRVDFRPVLTGQDLLIEVFNKHLDGRPTIAKDFQRRIVSDLASTRPTGDPGRAYYYHVPPEPKPAWLMTPEEEEAEQGGKLLSGAMAFVNGVGDLIRLVEKVDSDARESRVAFWKCYATRCSQAGKTFYAYSHAMWTKDTFYFLRPAVTPRHIVAGLRFLGEGAIDGGPVSHCDGEHHALKGALAEAVNRAQGNPMRSAEAAVAVMKGPVYATWQACRDRMEYIFRPRFL